MDLERENKMTESSNIEENNVLTPSSRKSYLIQTYINKVRFLDPATKTLKFQQSCT